MNPTKELSIVGGSGRGLTRREAGRQLLAFASSGALAWISCSHPVWRHLADEHLMGIAETSAQDAHFHLLSASQFETLSFLAEAIVPGSSKAKAAEFIDLLLSVEQEKNRREFADSLSAFEAESAKRYGKKVAAVLPADLNEMLKDASSRRETDGKMPPLGAAFANLKAWISGAYYSSEIGMRELGWSPDRVFSEFPGCTHSDHNG